MWCRWFGLWAWEIGKCCEDVSGDGFFANGAWKIGDLLSLDLGLTWCRAEGGGVLDLWMGLGLVLLGGLVGGNSSS